MRNLVWTFWLALVLAVFVTLISSIFLARQWSSFQLFSQLENNTKNYLQILSVEIQNSIDKKSELEKILLRSPINEYGEIYLVNSSGLDVLNRNMPEEIMNNLRGQPIKVQTLFSRVIKLDSGELYSLIIRPYSPRPLWNLFKKFGLFWIVFAALVVSGLISWWLAIKFARPIKHIAEASSVRGGGHILPAIDSKVLNRRDEIGKLARQLRESGMKIQDLIKNQKDLLRDVSHEVRSPLARLQVAAETLELDSKDKKALNQIKDEVTIIDQLVQDLLHLSHFDRPSVSHKIERFPLSDLVNECIKRTVIVAKKKNLSLKINPESQKDIHINAIKLLIERALDNVINNAIRYSPQNGQITISFEKNSKYCLLKIHDEGDGVNDKDLEKIFEPFFRLDSSRNRQTGGFGLGLSLVKRILDLHKGSVAAFNHLDGFMIEMKIPLHEDMS